MSYPWKHFLNLYIQQVRNEFTTLEAFLPQGYVYTLILNKFLIKSLEMIMMSYSLL